MIRFCMDGCTAANDRLGPDTPFLRRPTYTCRSTRPRCHAQCRRAGAQQRAVIPTQNYDSVIKFSPSVQNVEPVGPGTASTIG